MPTYDWFSKFTRSWAAGFACQIALPALIGYLLFLMPLSPKASMLGAMLMLAAELLVIPGAVLTAVVAALCVALTQRLKTAVIASALIGFIVPLLIFAPAIFYQSV